MAVLIKWVGLAGPITKKNQGYFTTSSGVDLLKSSIRMILGCRKGASPMNVIRGSKLYLIPFEQDDAVAEKLIQVYVVEAIAEQEPRVEILGFDIQRENENELRTKIYMRQLELPVQKFDVEFILERA